MSSKISDEEITELCKAIEVYQNELMKSENEIKELKIQLENTTEKLKLYEELEETILQLDNDLTSCKTTLNQKIDECDELQKENQELQLLIKSTTDCLEEQLQYQQQQHQQQHHQKGSSTSLTSQEQQRIDETDLKNLKIQLAENEKMNRFQDEKIQKYELKLQRMQQSIEQLQSENEALRTKNTASVEQGAGSCIRAHSPVNLVPRNKPSGVGSSGVNTFQRKTPPRSARRLMQMSSPTNYGDGNKSQIDSPRSPGTSSEHGSRNDLRRHSSYTTGDYVVSYAMRQNGDPNRPVDGEGNGDETQDPPIPVVITSKKSPKTHELTTHPYYPHSATSSILWQETVAQQKPFDAAMDTKTSREQRSMDLKARRNRHSFEDRSDLKFSSPQQQQRQQQQIDKVESPDQTSQAHLYSPLEGTPRVDSQALSPRFTQPRVLSQTQFSVAAAVACNENIPQRHNPKFTVRRNLDEEEEGRTIASTRWKLKGFHLNSPKVVPMKIPVSSPSTTTNGHKSFSHTTTSSSNTTTTTENLANSNTLMRSLSNPTSTEGEYKSSKGFHRYNGSSPSQHSLVSSSVPSGKTQWQHARVQVSGDSCLSLAQLPSNSKPMPHMSSPKTRTCSDSSDEYHKARTLEPSDEESDHDFEIERRGGGRMEEGDEEDEDEDGDCDDDCSVKVEIGGFSSSSSSSKKQQQHEQKHQASTHSATATSSSSSSRRRNRRYVDLGNITLDCE